MTQILMPCPYCHVRPAESDDHVFPQFLGGKAKIQACTDCNNTFGHTFEGTAAGHFKNLMLLFRRCGMPTTKPMVWHDIVLTDGERYNIDQDLKAVLTDPVVQKDDHGKIVKVRGDPWKVKEIMVSLEKKGQKLQAEESTLDLNLHRLDLSFALDDNLRRLAIKMSIASANRLGESVKVSGECRSYLLSGTGSQPAQVLIAWQSSAELKTMRPKLGHLVYVRHDERQGRSYSVVQFFGFIQLYCDLGHDAGLRPLSLIATHDPVTHLEKFRQVDPSIDFPVPSSWSNSDEASVSMANSMLTELQELYGDQAPQELTGDFSTAPRYNSVIGSVISNSRLSVCARTRSWPRIMGYENPTL
jgi:hypothetical protein